MAACCYWLASRTTRSWSGSRTSIFPLPSAGVTAKQNSDGPASTPSQLRPKVAPQDWIEIEVLYEDGVAFPGNCVVELPGGRSTEGPPGDAGIIRMDGIDPGSCKLTFPELDAAAFKSA